MQRRVEQPHGDRQPVHRFEDADEVGLLLRAQLLRARRLRRPGCRRGSCAARSAAGRRGTCARCGTGRCPRRRTRAPSSRLRGGRRSCAPSAGGSSSAQPRIVPKWPVGSGVITATSPSTISPVVPEIEMTSPSCTVTPPATNCFAARSIFTASAPQIAGVPMPRATTAACDTRPPRDVRMPSAAIMPCRSSGDVSGRTRITCSPASWRASASSAVKYTLPTAAPGDAFSPLASTVNSAFGSNCGCSNWSSCAGCTRSTASRLSIRPSLDHLDGHAQRGRGRALADARLQHEQAALLDRELDVAHVAVVVLELLHHAEQLLVRLGELVAHRVERLGDADAGDDVFALRVREEVAVRACSHRSTGCA